MVATSHPQTAVTHRHGWSRFFIYAAILMLIVVALGFGKSFFLRPLFSDKPLPVHVVVHGVTMAAWYVLFLTQACLVSAGRINAHRKLGIAGVTLAICVVVTGVLVNLNVISRMQELGLITNPEELRQGAMFALGGISGLVPFAILVFLAVLLRRRSAVHKRLMFWAFVVTLGPAFANTRPLGQALDALVASFLPFFPSDLIWFVALMTYDWMTIRRFHAATYIPFLLLTFFFIIATEWIVSIEPLQDWLLAYAQRH